MCLLGQLKLNTVICFVSAGTVFSNNFNDYLRHGWAFAADGCFDFLFNEPDIVGVAVLNLLLKPAHGFRVSQSLAGALKVQPANPKSSFGCSETSSENVVESIEISSPSSSGDQTSGDFVPKTI